MTSLLDYLTSAAENNPTGIAISEDDRALTYSELVAYSDNLASVLQQHGAGPGERVALYLPSGVDLVVALWGILKTGAAYVPIDVGAPEARVRLICERVRPVAVIAAPSRFPGMDLPIVEPRSACAEPKQPLPVQLHSEYPAYILHTSGSTGIPKGVVLTHRNAMAFVDWAVGEFHIHAGDRIAAHAPAHFDLSVLDIFGAARAAATLLPVPARARMFGAELAEFLQVRRATVLYCVPSALTLLSRVADAAALRSLRCVLFAGEVCPAATLAAMWTLAPQAHYANLFGPTETNVCTRYRVTADDLQRAPLPIGRPIPGVTARVMASSDREAAVGEAGELYVSGPTVAAGYWGDPAQTKERFVETPYGRAYCTGDIVVRSEDGLLYFRGRADRQVKTRGYRVELDEIEMIMRSHRAVDNAAVIAVPDADISHRLIAVVTTSTEATPGQLRQACAVHLPGYAIPAVHIVPELPLTSTGKVDHSAAYALIRHKPGMQPVQRDGGTDADGH